MSNTVTTNMAFQKQTACHANIPFVGKNNSFVNSEKCKDIPSSHNKLPFVINRHIYGFTLIELMVTVVVASILSALAIPSMRTFIQNARITTQANELLSDLSFARSEAVKRAANVTVCNSASSTAASPACTASLAWGAGRVIFVDTNANDTIDVGEVLRVREILDGANTLAATVNQLVYTRTGATTAGAQINFNLCDTRLVAFGRLISVATTGRVALSKPPASCA